MSVLLNLQTFWRARNKPTPTPADKLSGKTILFIGGLHRSGTSPLHSLLRSHPDISGFRETGVIEDEGQHLQNVLPPDNLLGGPGHFAYDAASQMDATSFDSPSEVRARLLQDWGPFWDLDKPVLLEKSPPNLLRSGMLEAVFPEAIFVFIVRHPVAVSLATQKWSGTPVCELFAHWVLAHRIFLRDLAKIDSGVVVLRYEDLVQNPREYLQAIYRLAGVSDFESDFEITDRNLRYFEEWERLHHASQSHLREFFASELAFAEKFGYRIDGKFVNPPSLDSLQMV